MLETLDSHRFFIFFISILLSTQLSLAYFGDFNSFGNFDLLLGVAKLKLKILEIPVRYRKRRYGETNISRWQHGFLLLKMVIFAARRIKFF